MSWIKHPLYDEYLLETNCSYCLVIFGPIVSKIFECLLRKGTCCYYAPSPNIVMNI